VTCERGRLDDVLRALTGGRPIPELPPVDGDRAVALLIIRACVGDDADARATLLALPRAWLGQRLARVAGEVLHADDEVVQGRLAGLLADLSSR
jgi:hypothetical protein